MKMWIFCLIVFGLFVVLLPIKLKFKAQFNILKNKGKIKFYFFKINFLSFNFKFKPKYILLSTKKGKNILVPIEFSKQAGLEMADLTYLLFDKTTIYSLKIFLNVGKEDDPFFSALMFGFLQTVSSIVLSILKTKKLDVVMSNKINSVYTKNSGVIDLSASISISLVDLLWAIIEYKINIKRIGKNYERT